MRKGIRCFGAGLLLAAGMLLGVPMTVRAEKEVVIDETAFPDKSFREQVEISCDTDKDGKLSSGEIKALTTMDVGYMEIKDLTGIGYFDSLTRLYCGNNQLTELDVSGNTALEELYCDNNELKELSVSKNTALITLDCSCNRLTKLDTNGVTALLALDCSYNRLTELKVSRNKKLNTLRCYANLISDMELNENLQYAKDHFEKLNIEDHSNGYEYVSYSGKTADYIAVDLYMDRAREGWVQYGKEWLGDNADWYYFEHNTPVKNWKKINGKWYYFNTGGVMQTGWQKISGKWYFFAGSGAMQTGWKTISGKTYFFKADGSMAANEWCKGYWLNADGTWTYKPKASWKQNKKGWWFGDTSGWYAKSGWQLIDSKWYYFDAKGYIVTGSRTINGKEYHFNSSGACLNP